MKSDKNNKDPQKSNPPGNRTPASKNYKDPVGSRDRSGTPKNSGYDEKQPKNDHS